MKSQATAWRYSRLLRRLLLITVLFTLAITVAAQSGRQKGPTKKTPSPVDATPTRTSTTRSTQQPGATPTPPKKDPDEVDSSDILRITSSLVPVPTSVVDAAGIAVTDLKLEDFELRVDGQVRPLSDLTQSTAPVRLAMLFDNSGSLDAARDLEKQAAMRFFRRVLRPVDQAAIYSVATDNYLAQPLTSDVKRLEQTIEGFGKPEGGTSLLDAILDAAAYLHPYQGRRVIVIVSDGVETTSRMQDFDAVVKRVLAENCQVYVVQTGHYTDANRRDLQAERRMEQLTAQTGGAVYVPIETADLEAAFIQIAADLAQQYVLSYYATDERRDGSYHTLALRVKTRRDTRVRARRGFYSPRV